MSSRKTFLEKTLALLEKDPRSLMQIATSAGVGYFWLRNLRRGSIPNPGVLFVQKLYSELSGDA